MQTDIDKLACFAIDSTRAKRKKFAENEPEVLALIDKIAAKEIAALTPFDYATEWLTLNGDRIIGCVYMLRMLYGWGLKDSKDFAEMVRDRMVSAGIISSRS